MGRTGLARPGAAVAAALLLLAFSGSVGAQPFVQVSREGSRFSIDATGVSVSTVLVALGREAGFSVQDSRPDIERPPIDIALSSATLDQTLNRLLDRQNHLIVYRSGVPTDHTEPGSIERIVLLAPRPDQAKVPVANTGTSPLAGPVQAAPIARAPNGQPAPVSPVAPGGVQPVSPGAVPQVDPDPAPPFIPGPMRQMPPGTVPQAATGSGPLPPGAGPDARQQMLEAAAAAAGSFAQQQGMSSDEVRALAEAAAAQQENPETHLPAE